MTMTDKIIAADETIPELPFKDVNFRIYRDVRFSHDPTPYKARIPPSFPSTNPFHMLICTNIAKLRSSLVPNR